MNNLVKLSLTLPLIATLSACGGGGEIIVEPPVDLSTLSAATSVQVLEQLDTGGGVEIDNNALKPTTNTLSLTYVAVNEDGIYGVAAESIPTNVTFHAEDSANVYVQMGQDAYTLTSGTVDGSIDGTSGDLSVTLSFGVNDIEFNSEDPNAVDVTTMQLMMDSTLSGASDCGAANVFCGGTLQVLKDNAEAASATLGATDYVTGVYGTQSNPEIGGVINYEDPGELAVVGSFVATKE